MYINAITPTSQQLIEAINKAINDGDLKTWAIEENTNDEILYSHTPAQWHGKALIQPTIYKNGARFTINWWANNAEPSHEVKGYITGRFTEVLLVHFGNYFTHLETFA